MKFHNMLNKMIDSHHARSQDICAAVGLNRAYVSKIRSGKFVPSDYQTILDIASAINLTDEEMCRLSESYQASKAPEDLSSAQMTFNALYRLTPPENIFFPTENAKPLKNSRLISGKKRVLQAVSQIASSAGSLMLFVTPYSDILKQVCNTASLTAGKNIILKWLIVKDVSPMGWQINLSVFTNMLTALFVHNAQIMNIKGELDFINKSIAFPFYIISENELLILNPEADRAIFFNDSRIVTEFTGKFSENAVNSSTYIKGYSDVREFFSDTEKFKISESENEPENDLYILKKYPCISFAANLSLIHNYIYDTGDKNELADTYIKFLNKFESVKTIYSIFPEDTIDIFLNCENFCEFGEHLSKPVPAELRRKMLEKVTDQSETDESVPNILRLPGFQNSSLYFINIITDGQMIFFYNFNDGYHIFTAYDKDIADSIVSYINSMRKCGIIRSKEDSVNIIRRKLKGG